MCKTTQNVRKSKKHFFGCPGKLHWQNAQKLMQKAKKNMQNHAKCAQIKKRTFWHAQASSTYKTQRNWSAKSTNMCDTMHNEQNKINIVDLMMLGTWIQCSGSRQAWTPIRSHWCGLGVACACGVGRAKKILKRSKGFKGLRPGKRQAWTPIRSHWCGLGVACACGVGRSKRSLQRCKGFLFKAWQTAGLNAHEKPLMWPWGACCLRGWACQEDFAAL